MKFDYDFFVVGAGSGGVRASRIAASSGARVGVAEERYLGGTCVNVGCVPKKLFVYGSHFHEEFQDAKGFGWTVGNASFDWPTLRDNKTKEIERLNGIYRNMLGNAGVDILDGHAELTGPNQIKIGDREITAEHILLAPGGWPYVPDFPGNEHVITSNEVFYLDQFPKRALVVGGGYIAVEFAGIFNGLGAETVQAYRGELFLRGFDEAVRHTLKDEMTKKGVGLRFKTNVASIVKREDGALDVTFEDGSTLTTDVVLYATGRRPKVDNLGLDKAGVELNSKGAVVVDDHFRTSVSNIYAVGDVIDRVQLTPVALAEGMALAKYLFGNEPLKVDYDHIPSAVFSQPSIATVGLSEEQAREQYTDIDIYTSRFRHMKHTLSGRDEKTFMKLIVDKNTDKVLGCHMVGSDAGEIVQGLAVALKAGATKSIFDSTIGIHPTAAEEFVTMRTPD